MKIKSPSDCGITKEHDYLGHFKNPKYLDRGHNSEKIFSEDQASVRLRGIPEGPADVRNPTITKRFDEPKSDPVKKSSSSSGGLYEWAHPEGTGTTKRGFNDIYPKVGK